MRQICVCIALFLASLGTLAQTAALQGVSTLGGTQASVSGLKSTNYLQGVIPSATITVYLTGTQTLATIYADGSGTPLSNPFTSNAAYSVNPGGWIFWASTNQGYDVVASGGISPNTYPSPVTLCTDCFPSSQIVTPGVTQILAGANINISPSGGTGVVTVSTGNSAPSAGWGGSLTADQGASDTTASISAPTSAPSGNGCFWVDTEWECFTSVTSLGGGNYTLNGLTRGIWTTTAATHSSGASVSGMIQSLSSKSQRQFAWTGGTSTTGYFFAVNCPLATSINDTIEFEVGCNQFTIFDSGNFSENATGPNFIAGSLTVGSNGSYASTADYQYRIQHTANIVRTDLPQQITAGIGFANGIADAVEAVEAPTAGAPGLTNFFVPSGSTTYTYVCQGADALGNNIPGTSASLTNLAASGWSGGEYVEVYCPPIPGATSISIYRTAGGPNTGLIDTISGATGTFNDAYVSASGGSPNPTNTTVPMLCTDGTQYCVMSGTRSTPPVSCTSGQEGWEYHNTAADADPALQRCLSGAWTPVISGVVSINDDSTPAQTFTGSGGITVTDTGSGGHTISVSGSAGTGTINGATLYNDSSYAATGTTIGGDANSYTLPLNLSTSQINTVLSTSNIAVKIQNGDAHTPFTNTNNDKIHDDRTDVPVDARSVKEWGAQCDAISITGQFNSSTNTITGYTFGAGAVGKTIMAVAPNASGVPTRYIAVIQSVSGGNAVMTNDSPFSTSSGWRFTLGHDDYAALTAALSAAASGGVGITLPMGNCFSSQPLSFTGQNISGQGVNQSAIVGPAGQDTLAVPDPSNPGYTSYSPHQHMHDFTIYFDAEIDATKPWQACNDSGCTNETALYRPLGIGDADANNPLNAQWIQGTGSYNTGATNGVASVTNGQTAICVPTGGSTGETLPTVGSQILFPYQATDTAMFETTVASIGSSCTIGSVAGTLVNLNASYTGATATQAEWFSGASIQNIQTAIPASGRTFPMQITLANPITPDPEFSQSGLAPYGVVQIDGEQCSYYGTSLYPIQSGNWINLTACAQNGTTAAAHSVGAFIFPLNPLNSALPWPVSPTLNSGTTTPSGAEYYPAVGVGNAAIAFPVYNGADFTGTEAIGQGHWNNLMIVNWPNNVNSPQNAIGYQVQNDTAGIYIVPLPFDSVFDNIYIMDPFYGIAEGTPSTNTHYYFTNGFPTADGNAWNHITVQSAAYPLWTIGEGSSHWKNTQVFSQSGTPPNNTWPGFTPAYSGAQGGWLMGGPYDDQNYCCNNNSGMQYTHIDGFYIEAEASGNPDLVDTQPLFQLDCVHCLYSGITPKSGGVTFIGGANQSFRDGILAGAFNLPIVNFGSFNIFDSATGFGGTQYSNAWGTGAFLNWGRGTQVNTSVNHYGNSAVWIPTVAGNSRDRVLGQTAETFLTGNVTTPYTSALNGFITPEEFNTSNSLDVAPMSVGWTFDDTAPITHSYTACNVSTGSGGCSTYQFEQGDRIYIGPDQRIVAGPYEMYTAFKTPAGANSFKFTVSALASGSGCSGGTVYSGTFTTTGTGWQTFGPILTDFTGYGGCVLNLAYSNASTAAQVQQAYVDFAPLAQNLVAQQITTVGSGTTATIFAGSGAPTGCGSTYANGSLYLNTSGTTGSMLYTCIGTTWTDIK